MWRIMLATLQVLSVIVIVGIYGEIENGLIRHISQISYRQCVSECSKRNHCLSARFSRHLSLCQLYRNNITVNNEVNERIYNKKGDPDCTVLAETCIVDDPESCGQPRSIPGSEILGNIPTVGSKIKYKCLYQSGFEISECLTNGSWGTVNLTCACGEVRDDNNIPIENVIWTRTEDETSVIATASCKNGTTARDIYKMTATCDIRTGQWSKLGDICCERLVNGDWTKIYSLPSSDTNGDLARSWGGGGGSDEKPFCQYRYSDIIDKWPVNEMSMIRIELWKDETVVAWANFSTHSTNKTSWFTPDKYLASSWSEQSGQWLPDDYTAVIRSGARKDTVRFYIGESSFSDQKYPIGLMVVSKFDLYSADPTRLEKTYIIYSRNGSYVPLSAKEETSTTGFADRLEVWVKGVS